MPIRRLDKPVMEAFEQMVDAADAAPDRVSTCIRDLDGLTGGGLERGGRLAIRSSDNHALLDLSLGVALSQAISGHDVLLVCMSSGKRVLTA